MMSYSGATPSQPIPVQAAPRVAQMPMQDPGLMTPQSGLASRNPVMNQAQMQMLAKALSQYSAGPDVNKINAMANQSVDQLNAGMPAVQPLPPQ